MPAACAARQMTRRASRATARRTVAAASRSFRRQRRGSSSRRRARHPGSTQPIRAPPAEARLASLNKQAALSTRREQLLAELARVESELHEARDRLGYIREERTEFSAASEAVQSQLQATVDNHRSQAEVRDREVRRGRGHLVAAAAAAAFDVHPCPRTRPIAPRCA